MIDDSGKVGNLLSLLRNKTKKYGNNRTEAPERDNDGRRKANGTGLAGKDSANGVVADRDRSDIRVFEEALATEHNDDSEYSERNRREAESERLVKIAKDNGKYISSEETKQLGKRFPKLTGESVVYIDKDNGKVYNVKYPFAKSPMKRGT
jgi:hypothetical protein